MPETGALTPWKLAKAPPGALPMVSEMLAGGADAMHCVWDENGIVYSVIAVTRQPPGVSTVKSSLTSFHAGLLGVSGSRSLP